MVFNVGSVSTFVINGISPFPSNISGVVMDQMVTNAISTVNTWIGTNLGTTNIPDQYFGVISDYATADALRRMAVQDNGVQFTSVGELNVNNTNLKEMAQFYQEQAEAKLKGFSKGVSFFKARG